MRQIKLATDTISRHELEELSEWMLAGNQLTKGEVTVEFEKAFGEFCGVKYCNFVSSGSSANLIGTYALQQLDRIPNGTVIAPAISWVTTVAPALQLGLRVHLCDCDPCSLGLDVDHLDKLCRQYGPGLVIAVHVLGHPNNMREIAAVCQRYGMTLMEDACEAFGSKYEGRPLGTFGSVGTFSFYYGHQISTIEGGMVVTNDRTVHNVLRSLRAHGWARDVDVDFREQWELQYDINEFESLYSFYFPGFNCRPTELSAFLGISQLRDARRIIGAREKNFELYRQSLTNFWYQESQHDILSSFSFGTLVTNRLETYRHLKKCGIESRPLICGNIGRQPFWIKQFGPTYLRHADVIHEHGIYLPNHASLSESDISYVVGEFQRVAIPLDSPHFTRMIAPSSYAHPPALDTAQK